MQSSRKTPPITIDTLQQLIAQSGIDLTQNQAQRLWQFHRFLRQKNPELNLTRIYNFENMVRKHYIDSIIILGILQKNQMELPDPLLDLGAGAGFPGIPLAIMRPEHKIILAEGRQNRVDFLEAAVAALTLKNTVVHGRNILAHRGVPTSGVITRAVETMDATIERVAGCFPEPGRVLFMKGPNCDEEIQAVRDQTPSAALLLDETYTLPRSQDQRRLVVWEIQPRPAIKPVVYATDISSESNPKYKMLLDLHAGRTIRKHKRALLGGRKMIHDCLAAFPERVESLVCSAKDTPEALRFIEDLGENPPVWRLDASLFREVDALNTGSPLLLLKIPDLPDWSTEATGCTLFLPCSDPENLGAALRSAAAFAVSQVVLLKEAAHPFLPRALRAAAGAGLHLNLAKGPGLSALQTESLPLFALDSEGKNIADVVFPEAFGLLAGLEGAGLPEHLTAEKVCIPISPRVESLNVSVAIGIALEYIGRQKGVC